MKPFDLDLTYIYIPTSLYHMISLNGTISLQISLRENKKFPTLQNEVESVMKYLVQLDPYNIQGEFFTTGYILQGRKFMKSVISNKIDLYLLSTVILK